jgi:hypothetical protein
MLNRDKRSLVLSLIIGDGSIGCYKTDSFKTGRLTIDHGIAQADYQAWKAQLLSDIFKQSVRVRTGHKGRSVQIMVRNKKFKAWRKFCYRNGKKSLPKILRFITHPEFALAVMLLDDGYVEPSFSKLADGTVKNYGSRLRFFCCDQTEEDLSLICKWFDDNFQVKTKILYMRKKSGKVYPYLKWSQADSLKLWQIIREFCLRFKSMQHKFRYIEQIYQYRMSQRVPEVLTTSDDIVHPTTKT